MQLLAFWLSTVFVQLYVLIRLNYRRNWQWTANKLASDYGMCCYLLDLRNHGSSPHNPDMSVESMAADVKRFFTEQGIHHSILLGHSMV